MLSNHHLYPNFYIEVNECAKQTGAPAKCIMPFGYLAMAVVNELAKGVSCKAEDLVKWGKDLKKIKEQCLDKKGKIHFYNLNYFHSLQ